MFLHSFRVCSVLSLIKKNILIRRIFMFFLDNFAYIPFEYWLNEEFQ